MDMDGNMQIPHIITANVAPVERLEAKILEQQVAIEAWFRDRWPDSLMPITCSVDIRNSGYKISTVDTNLFPAGFNNLNQDFLSLCVQAAQYTIGKYYPKCRRIMIIGENHTRNQMYIQNLISLKKIFSLSGYDVKISRVDTDFVGEQIDTGNGLLDIYAAKRRGNRLVADGFNPCLILLNRDLSEGVPEELLGIEQQVTPLPEMGWYNRLKSEHFHCYQDVASDFAKQFSIDAWGITTDFQYYTDIDFMTKQGLYELAKGVDKLLQDIHTSYQENNITEEPFVAIKSNSGTYGMSVMMVKSGDEIRNMNRKQRIKMSATKGKQKVSSVIIQEGVYSYESYEDAVAEPVVYLIGHSVVGGFYRIHKNKGIADNLNSPGMEFKPLAFSNPCNTPSETSPNRFYIYGVIARLALLAAIEEIQEVVNA